MNYPEAQAAHGSTDEPVTRKGRQFGEAIGAIAVIALAIVGLAGIYSPIMAGIGVIVIGAAILVEGQFFGFGAESEAVAGAAVPSDRWLSSEFLGGISAVILGILALLGVGSDVLLAVAVLAVGASFVFSSRSALDLGGHALTGLAAIVLGILAVVGLDRLTLVLVALLCLGALSLYGRAAWGSRQIGQISGTP